MIISTSSRASELAAASGNTALVARTGELAGFLAAPLRARLTEEQRALALGIARRLIFVVAAQLDGRIDCDRLWASWSSEEIPSADLLALPCFARAEEYRWRVHSTNRQADDTRPATDPAVIDMSVPGQGPSETGASAIDHAQLVLRIADGRRFDPVGFPCLPVSDIGITLYRSLALDIAAYALDQNGNDRDEAHRLGESVTAMLEAHAKSPGIDAVTTEYFQALDRADAVSATLTAIVQRQQWGAAVALAAGGNRLRYDDTALAIVTGRPSDITQLFRPLAPDAATLAPLIASLETLPHRSLAPIDHRDDHDHSGDDGPAADVVADLLQRRARAIASKTLDLRP